ncbi:MAG: trypsin-like serine protease [Deltaproteobacteria bacterium]|nr:trypsin-like serine protease [Deltaproteobacteria bacterium]MBI3294241.1 trypsin-like serine protease [Deltaproteobacteria bacterium]
MLFFALIFSQMALALEGGLPAEPGQFPSTVLFEVGEENFCTAFKFAPKKYALAAHCVIERGRRLEKLGALGRVRDEFRPGQPIRLHHHTVKTPNDEWDLTSPIATTRVHVSFHYSDPALSLLKPAITRDLAVIELEDENDVVMGAVADKPIASATSVIKMGFGCEDSRLDAIEECRHQTRRLKYQATNTLAPENSLLGATDFLGAPMARLHEWISLAAQSYLYTPGLKDGQGASLSYFDSGGPLIAVGEDKVARLVGINSRGLLDKSFTDHEVVLFDAHSRVDTGALRELDEASVFYKVIDFTEVFSFEPIRRYLQKTTHQVVHLKTGACAIASLTLKDDHGELHTWTLTPPQTNPTFPVDAPFKATEVKIEPAPNSQGLCPVTIIF